MRFDPRPYLIAAAAIGVAVAVVVVPASPPLRDIEVPAVQPAGSELNDFNTQDIQDLLGVWANTEATVVAPTPDLKVLTPTGGSPDLSGLLNPTIVPPVLGPLDLDRLNLGAMGSGNLAGPVSSDASVAE
jgi:hypothetical protein